MGLRVTWVATEQRTAIRGLDVAGGLEPAVGSGVLRLDSVALPSEAGPVQRRAAPACAANEAALCSRRCEHLPHDFENFRTDVPLAR